MSTILVVDDQPVNRQYLATLLGYFHHHVLQAGDGIEGLESLRCGRVELVISDLLMPAMDGYDFLQRMRRNPEFQSMPFIFYTAATYEPLARALAEASGVRHFLTKPAEPEVILAAANSALDCRQAAGHNQSLTRFNSHMMTAPADPIDPNAVVFVVEDDTPLRDGLSFILRDAGLKIETYATAENFLDNFDPNQPGCLLLDICLPGMSGIQLLEKLRARRIDVPAIILTGHGDLPTAISAMRLHALDYLQKPFDRRILLAKIYGALQQDSIKRREQLQTQAIRILMNTLTAREKDLLKLLVEGNSSKQIASQLKLSVKTISNHRSNLMAKTQAVNLADLVRMSMIADNN